MRSRHGSLMKAEGLKGSRLTVIDFINVTLLSSQLGHLSFGRSDESPVVLNNPLMMLPNSPLLLSHWQPAELRWVSEDCVILPLV